MSKYRLKISQKGSLIFCYFINLQCKTTDILLIIQAEISIPFHFVNIKYKTTDFMLIHEQVLYLDICVD